MIMIKVVPRDHDLKDHVFGFGARPGVVWQGEVPAVPREGETIVLYGPNMEDVRFLVTEVRHRVMDQYVVVLVTHWGMK